MGTWEGGWDKGLKGKYEEELRRRRGWEEQMDMPVMNEEILVERVEKLKKNKAAGPDMVRGEVLQEVIKSKKCREALVVGYNGIVIDERIPSSWDKANTRMIGKEKKTEVNIFRPIAITSVGYKLYLGFLKDEMEDSIVKMVG